MKKKLSIFNLNDLESFASGLAKELSVSKRKVVFLRGNLGAGKTTLSQMLLKALGFTGRVKSPTYTLIEPYDLVNQKLYHLDLYRLQSDDELCHLGIDDLLQEDALFLIEWPERLQSIGVQPDIEIELQLDAKDPTARTLRILS